jgi:hypothetical protein
LVEDIAHLCQLYLQHEQPMFYFTDYAKTVDQDHDRIEIRECWTLDAAFYGPSIRHLSEWAKLQTVVMIRREGRLSNKTEIHTHYYSASLKGTAERFLQVIRENWGIENSVHWVCDMDFNEYKSRLHKDNGRNLASSHIAPICSQREDAKVVSKQTSEAVGTMPTLQSSILTVQSPTQPIIQINLDVINPRWSTID